MKRLIFAFIILAVLVAVGVGAKVYFGGGFSLPTSTSSPIATSNGFQYATPTAVTVPPIGAYNLESIDLGDGPVPLVTVPLDTWGGYAALFSANKGIDPNKASLFYQYGHFAVKLVNIEDSTAQLKGYAGGQYPIIWAQMDSLPLLVDAFKVDKRVIPRVLGLFDWSNGGDGIVAKSVINSPADLKGKTILTSSNTPYAFMLLWYLAQYGMTGNDVKVVWVDDGDKALELFKNSPEIVAWVTWSPYLQDVLNSKSNHFVPNTRLLINSRDANPLIPSSAPPPPRSSLTTALPRLARCACWPAWKCVSHVDGLSHPGTPIVHPARLPGAPVGPPGNGPVLAYPGRQPHPPLLSSTPSPSGRPLTPQALRTGWSKLNSFHVCITSYQLVVQVRPYLVPI